MTFVQAIDAIRAGHSVCRECELGCYRLESGIIVYEDENGFTHGVEFSFDDVTATDWEVLE